MRLYLLQILTVLSFMLVGSVFAEPPLQERGALLPSPENNKSGDFFPAGSADTVFAPRVKMEDKAELEYFPREKSEFYKDMFATAEEQIQPADKKALSEEELAKLPKAERILAKYGSPAENMPVLANAEAPKPFKAIMESLQEGEDALAFQYAKQYSRYLRDIQNRTARVVSMTGQAMQREGMTDGAEWKSAPQFEEDKMLLEQDLIESQRAKAEGNQDQRYDIPESLEGKARALVRQAGIEDSAEVERQLSAGQAPAVAAPKSANQPRGIGR